MFRKFQDRITAAASAAFGSSGSDLQRLQALGFTESQAASALQATAGNVDRAAELLLSQQQHQPQQQQQHHQQNATHAIDLTTERDNEDEAFQRVLQESLQQEEERRQRQPRTAAMNKAAAAADARRATSTTVKTTKTKGKGNSKSPPPPSSSSSGPTSRPTGIQSTSEVLRHHHPDVKLIPKLQDKSTEEQVLRTADRMKNHPAAVDTIHKALTALQQDPDNDKFRRIDKSSAGYQRSVATAVGAQDFLRAMKFTTVSSNNSNSNSNMLILSRSMYDPALIYLGITALEQIKLTTEYGTAKQQQVFEKEIKSVLNATATTTLTSTSTTKEQATKRAAYLAKCPVEPSAGRGALLQVQLVTDTTVRRRFDSDDTVQDVLYWLGGTYGTDITDKLVSGVWCLVDLNRHPVVAMDVATTSAAVHHTLQYVGCWPSGRLELRPASSAVGMMGGVDSNKNSNAAVGESRGLASGASSDDE